MTTFYNTKNVQFNLKDETSISIHAENEYYDTKKIGNFNFLHSYGYYYTLEGKQIDVQRFSTILNYFFKVDSNFGYYDQDIKAAKENAKRIKAAENKEYKLELREKDEKKAIHFINDLLNIEIAEKYQAKSIDQLTEIVNYTFKNASKKTIKNVINAILNFNILDLNSNDTIVENENATIEQLENNIDPIDNNNTSYIVGNRSFSSYEQALIYCHENDFDHETMIIKEVAATMQTSDIIDGTSFNFNYDHNDLSQYEIEKDISKHTVIYSTLKNREFISIDHIRKLIDHDYTFRIKILNVKPYNKSQYVLIDLTFKYYIKPITLYLKKEGIEEILKAA